MNVDESSDLHGVCSDENQSNDLSNRNVEGMV